VSHITIRFILFLSNSVNDFPVILCHTKTLTQYVLGQKICSTLVANTPTPAYADPKIAFNKPNHAKYELKH